MAVSAAARARSLTATKAMPGLADSAFCEPPTATSMPHSSNANGTAPRLDTTSTITSAPASRATVASRSTGWITPVEVSECVSSTAFVAGCAASASATLAGSSFVPHSSSVVWTVRPWASARRCHRWEKNPASGTNTSSPGEKRFCTADSSPPVPDEVNRKISAESVRYSSRRRAVTSVISFPKPGPRW